MSYTIDKAHVLALLERMLLIRRFEARCYELYQAQKIRGFMHLYDGEEAVAVGVMEALTPEDAVVATYREHGQALARGLSPGAIMAELYGKQEGCSRGRGGSMHLFDASRRFFGGNAIVGGSLPLSIGLALADRMRGLSRVTCTFFGDGAAAEGEFSESLNLAVLWRLPVLFVCENNLYAMGTAVSVAHGVTDLSAKAAAHGVAADRVDGMDVLAVEQAARLGAARVREGAPYFLECMTYRFRGHSMFDGESYRSREEVEGWRERDPISILSERLKEIGLLSAEEVAAREAAADRLVEEAVAFAEAGTWEPVAELGRFVTSERQGAR